MTTSILYPALALVACTMVAACAGDSQSNRQRPVYSHENVEMGPNESGQQYRADEPPPRTDPYTSDRFGR